MTKHLYVFKNELKQYSKYKEIMDLVKSTEGEYKITEDYFVYRQVITTKNDMYIFMYYSMLEFVLGMRVHYLYIDKELKDDEMVARVFLPMLAHTEQDIGERVKWI